MGWASLVAQLVKNLPAIWETWVQSLGWDRFKLDFFPPQEIGYTHMKIAEGVNSLLQMAGLLARLCQKTMAPVAS